MFGFVSNIVSSSASLLFPLFASYKALKANDIGQLTPWLMYWCVLAILLFVEGWTWFILQWIPFYSEAKAVFVLWMVLPQTQGAKYLYLTYLHPEIERYEHQIDSFLVGLHNQAKSQGMSYVHGLIEQLQDMILGPRPSSSYNSALAQAPVGQNGSTTSVSSEGYISALFFRFRTVPIGPIADAIPQSLLSLVTSSGPSLPGSGRFATLQSTIASVGMNSQDTRTYIAAQKQKLTDWIALLDAAMNSDSTRVTLPETRSLVGCSDTVGPALETGSSSHSRTPSSSAPGTLTPLSEFEEVTSDAQSSPIIPKEQFAPGSRWAFWKSKA